ncbi:hypothetical protein CMI47_19465 [Candidatus Pacearchaeota archaeon]|nr:hypothetical protein [Candidatus Pacearchaeota archaeon]|tara:strand:- start:94 stop:324 length:231 start_codon:yes stop_codon:yes gene_type:complete
MDIGDLVYYKGFVFCGDTDPPLFEKINNFRIGLVIAREKSSYLLSVDGRVLWACTDDDSVIRDWDMILISKSDNKE